MKNNKYKIKFNYFILILFIIIFIYSVSKIVIFYLDLNKNDYNYKQLVKEVVSEELEEKQEEKSIIIDFDKLISINNDVIGWIVYNQNKINYPILHTSDNSYYLNHSFDKKYNQAGSIFMDYRNISFDDRNVVLFGHSLSNGTMFGSIKDIFKNNFFDNEDSNYIQIYNTKNELLTYQIFSYYIIEKEEYYITTSFKNDNDFLKFLNTIKRRSYKKFNIDMTKYDKILTLSTCSGSGETTKRKVVHAKFG